MGGDRLVPEPLQERAAATVERVIASTADLLDRAEESDVTLAAIAQHSGISTGSLYHHFGSREDAIVAAHARRFARLMQHQRELLGPALRAHDAPGLLAGIEALIGAGAPGAGASGRDVALTVLSASRHRPELLQRVVAELAITVAEFAELIASAQGSRIIRADLPPDAVAVLMQLVLLMSGTAVASESRVSAVEWAEIVRVLTHALLVDDGPAHCGPQMTGDARSHGPALVSSPSPVTSALSDATVTAPAEEQALLQAVIDTLDEHGSDAVVLRELCDRVGVSASWLYRHFGVRRQLIAEARLEIARRQSLREVAAFTELLDVGGDREQLVGRLIGLVQGIGAASSPAPHLERIDLVASALHEPDLLATWGDVTAVAMDRMTTTLEELQQRGSMRDDLSARAVGRLLWGLMTAGVIARPAGIDADAWAGSTAVVIEVLVGTRSDARRV